MEINLRRCVTNDITPNEYVILSLLNEKEYDKIAKVFGKEGAIVLRNRLIDKGFVVSDKNVKFTVTELNSKKVNKVLNINDVDIKFWDWYSIYPVRHNTRIFRAANPDAKLAQKHKEKYLRHVKTIEDHEFAMKATIAFIESQSNNGKLQYLPQIDRVLNNKEWEKWEVLIGSTTVTYDDNEDQM